MSCLDCHRNKDGRFVLTYINDAANVIPAFYQHNVFKGNPSERRYRYAEQWHQFTPESESHILFKITYQTCSLSHVSVTGNYTVADGRYMVHTESAEYSRLSGISLCALRGAGARCNSDLVSLIQPILFFGSICHLGRLWHGHRLGR